MKIEKATMHQYKDTAHCKRVRPTRAAEHFAQTVNKLKGKVTILFITHQLPKGLQVDEAVILGQDKNNNKGQQQEGMMI